MFGFMDGAITSPGLLQSCELVPYTQELVEAGFFTGYALDLPPIPEALTSSEVTYYRHDQSASPLARFMPVAERAQIEDKRAARSGKVASKEERREANESMPHTFEVIPAGTPLLGTLRLGPSNDIDPACFTLAVATWRQRGAHLGGGRGKGHGACAVQVLRATRLPLGRGPVPVNAETTLPVETFDASTTPEHLIASYNAHLASVKDETMTVLVG